MSFNLAAFTRDHARAAGISEEHLSAVVNRAEMARMAVRSFELVGTNDPDERDRCMRVIAAAVADHAAGTLERLV